MRDLEKLGTFRNWCIKAENYDGSPLSFHLLTISLMLKFHARFLFGLLAATALFLSVYALAPPVKRNDDIVLLTDICASVNVDLTVLLTSLGLASFTPHLYD